MTIAGEGVITPRTTTSEEILQVSSLENKVNNGCSIRSARLTGRLAIGRIVLKEPELILGPYE